VLQSVTEGIMADLDLSNEIIDEFFDGRSTTPATLKSPAYF
jgi:hypothetical protein